MTRLPLAPSAGMVMSVAAPAPRISPTVISNPPHSILTVWSAPNRTLLVIDTVAVAESPPSVSSVTSLLDESRSVKLQVGVGVVRVTLAAGPGLIPFTARTSKVYSVSASSPVTLKSVSFGWPGALLGMSTHVVAAGTEVPSA